MSNAIDRAADSCADQLPIYSNIGRGIGGDSFRVVLIQDSDNITKLQGQKYDAAKKEWTPEWTTENLNAGELKYQYVLDPLVPGTFTIKFMYVRPGYAGWEWTSPAIPYIDTGKWEASTTLANEMKSYIDHKFAQLEERIAALEGGN